MTPIHSAIVENGKLTFQDRNAFEIWVGSLIGEVEVIVRKQRKNRTTPQNEYYWGVVLPIIAKETGHTKEELHEIFKRMFLTAQTLQYRGKEIRIPGSTATLNTKEFGEYLEKVFVEAGELGLIIPESNKVDI